VAHRHGLWIIISIPLKFDEVGIYRNRKTRGSASLRGMHTDLQVGGRHRHGYG